MKLSPSFEDIFAVLAAASGGDITARVALPADPPTDDMPSKLAVALNALFDDRSASADVAKREALVRSQLASRLQLLTGAVHEFSSTTYDLERLLDVVARRLGELVGDMCAIRTISDDGEWLESSGAAYHRDPELLGVMREVMMASRQRVGEGASGRAAATGESLLTPKVVVADFPAWREPRHRASIERLGVSTAMTVPLSSRGRVVGIATLMRASGAPYTEDDLRVVQSVAEHAALAIENARSFAAERAARDAAERATRALRQSEARFARLGEAGILGILVTELDGHVLEINDTLLRLVGYSREEILSSRIPWRTLTSSDWLHVDERAIGQLKTSRVAGLREKELTRKDGTRVPVLVGAAMLEGETSTCISFMLDLTDRKADGGRPARRGTTRSAYRRVGDGRHVDGRRRGTYHLHERPHGRDSWPGRHRGGHHASHRALLR